MADTGGAALGWIDLVLLGGLAVSVLVGLWRGLVFEFMSLVGWVVAYVGAPLIAPLLAAHLPLGTPGTALPQALAFGLAFLAVLLAWALLARLVRLLVHATPLTVVDRLLGAGFGLVRGAVLLLAVGTVVALTPAVRSAAWQDSRVAGLLAVALQGLKPVLPADLARHLPDRTP